jgi:hypothetical protein
MASWLVSVMYGLRAIAPLLPPTDPDPAAGVIGPGRGRDPSPPRLPPMRIHVLA